MQPELVEEYRQIGEDRAAAGKHADREKRWFFLKVAGLCWVWAIIGLVFVGISLRVKASVGPIYFPDLMARAELYFSIGMFIGTAGPIATLIVAWRRAMARGYLD